MRTGCKKELFKYRRYSDRARNQPVTMKLVLIFAVLATTLVASEAFLSKWECTASEVTSTTYSDNDCKTQTVTQTYKSGECKTGFNSKATCEGGGKIKYEQFKVEKDGNILEKNKNCQGKAITEEVVNGRCNGLPTPAPNNSAGIVPTMVLAVAASLLGCSLAYL